MRAFLQISVSLLLFAWACPAGADEPPVPELHERVTDLTGTLPAEQIRELGSTLDRFERETSNQIAVLLVPSIEDESIEEYSMRVAEQNKFGKKGRDNGVLLVIAKDERKMRIEVGYGLEGVLTDALSDEIIRRVIAPKFRRGDYGGGVADGVEAIMLATKGEFKGEGGRSQDRLGPPLAILLVLIFGLLRLFARGRRRTYLGSGGYRTMGPWIGGGGGGFGGGGGGGGFSGGGGSFGGGGASGSW